LKGAGINSHQCGIEVTRWSSGSIGIPLSSILKQLKQAYRTCHLRRSSELTSSIIRLLPGLPMTALRRYRPIGKQPDAAGSGWVTSIPGGDCSPFRSLRAIDSRRRLARRCRCLLACPLRRMERSARQLACGAAHALICTSNPASRHDIPASTCRSGKSTPFCVRNAIGAASNTSCRGVLEAAVALRLGENGTRQTQDLVCLTRVPHFSLEQLAGARISARISGKTSLVTRYAPYMYAQIYATDRRYYDLSPQQHR